MIPEAEAFQRALDGGAFAGMNSLPVMVTMPFPVSIHEIFRKHNGSHLSERYRKWRDEAGWMLLSQKPRRVLGKVNVLVELCAPDRRERDGDNYLKGPIDILVAHKIIEGDSNRFVRNGSFQWVELGPPCTVTITSIGGT